MKNLIRILGVFLLVASSNLVFSQTAVVDETTSGGIIYMLEEEKVAKDVYDHFEMKYGNQIFINISEAEGRHEKMMEELAIKSGVIQQGEYTSTEAGIYENEKLQNLYSELVEEGDESVLSALRVGAKIEELNIHDLQTSLGNTSDERSIKVYSKLIEASKRHLNAFVRNIEKQGGEYTSQILEQGEYGAIIGSQKQEKSCCANKGEKGKNGKAKKCSDGESKSCCKSTN